MADVEAADHAQVFHAVFEALFGDVDGVLDAEAAGEAEAPVVDVGERSIASEASVRTTWIGDSVAMLLAVGRVAPFRRDRALRFNLHRPLPGGSRVSILEPRPSPPNGDVDFHFDPSRGKG